MKRLKELDEYLLNLTNLKGLENRFSLLQLNDLVSDFLGFNVEFEKFTTETDDFKLGLDLYLFNDKLLYVDIYYLLDNNGMLYITDYDLDSEHALNEHDYYQFITDSDQDLLSKNSAYAFYIDNLDKFDEIAKFLTYNDKECLSELFYILVDKIKNVREIDFPLGG